jgi:O-antigen ligase
MANLNNLLLKNSLLTRGTITFVIAGITMLIIPIYHWYLPPLMILWVVFWLLETRFNYTDLKTISFTNKTLFCLFILFYLWQVIGMLYSDNISGGWRNIELHLSLLVFPLVLILPGTMIRKRVNTLLRIFTFGTLLYLLICLGYALYRSIILVNGQWIFNPHPAEYPWLNYFYGSLFSVFHHPSYVAMYAAFSVFIAGEFFFDRAIKKIIRICWLLIALSLIILIYLLSSRAGILTMFFAIPVYLLNKFKIRGLRKIAGFILLVSLICYFILLPVLKSNPRFNLYFTEESKKEISQKILNESRLGIWKSSWSIIRDNFFFGVGTGDIQDELNKEYKLVADADLKSDLNAHNQYLEVLLENGFAGLLIFLSIFVIMFYIAVREDNILYLMFAIIVFISFLFETMLNRLAGVSFYSLFAFLLVSGSVYKSKIINK